LLPPARLEFVGQNSRAAACKRQLQLHFSRTWNPAAPTSLRTPLFYLRKISPPFTPLHGSCWVDRQRVLRKISNRFQSLQTMCGLTHRDCLKTPAEACFKNMCERTSTSVRFATRHEVSHSKRPQYLCFRLSCPAGESRSPDGPGVPSHMFLKSAQARLSPLQSQLGEACQVQFV